MRHPDTRHAHHSRAWRILLAAGAGLAIAACAQTAPPSPALAAARSIEMADAASLGFDPAKLETARAALQADVASGKLPGAILLVGRHDKVAMLAPVGMQGPGSTTPMSEETIFRVFSMTKPIVSVTAMKLVEEGKLSVDDPVSKYIPAFANVQVQGPDGTMRPADKPVLVRHLMSHTSGLIYGFLQPNSPLGKTWAAGGENRNDLAPVPYAELLAGLPLVADPGTAWNYSRSTDVLGAVVEVASGQSLADAVRTRVTGPLGMTDTAFYQPEANRPRFAESKHKDALYYDYAKPTPFLSGGGGLSSTVEDYLRFVLMLANDGAYKGVRILKPETLQRMRQDETSPEIRQKGLFFPGRGMGFGLGFSLVLDDTVQRPGNGTFSWNGIAGTEFWVDPKNDVFMVFAIQDRALLSEYQRKNRGWIYDALVDPSK